MSDSDVNVEFSVSNDDEKKLKVSPLKLKVKAKKKKSTSIDYASISIPSRPSVVSERPLSPSDERVSAAGRLSDSHTEFSEGDNGGGSATVSKFKSVVTKLQRYDTSLSEGNRSLTPPVRGLVDRPVRHFVDSPVRHFSILNRPVRHHTNVYGSPVRHIPSAIPVPVRKKEGRKVIAVDVSPIRVKPSRIPTLNKSVPGPTKVVRRRGPPPDRTYEAPFQEQFNVHASDTDGYDSDLLRGSDQEACSVYSDKPQPQIAYENLEVFDKEVPSAPPIDEVFANILKRNWTSPKSLEQLKSLFAKYSSPTNCAFDAPLVNKELRGLMSSTAKQNDTNLMGIQKSMANSMNACIQLLEEAKAPSPNLQAIAQTVADISAMLGHASSDLSKKRREYITKPMKFKYSSLRWEKEEDGLLFGSDVPQKIKDLNFRSQLKYQPTDQNTRGTKRKYSTTSLF